MLLLSPTFINTSDESSNGKLTDDQKYQRTCAACIAVVFVFCFFEEVRVQFQTASLYRPSQVLIIETTEYVAVKIFFQKVAAV